MDAAAAASLRIAVGSGQNDGRNVHMNAVATVSMTMARATRVSKATLAASAEPAISSGTAVCQRRSPVRSDDHPAAIISASPTTYGRAEINVTVKFGRPDRRLMIVGSQN